MQEEVGICIPGQLPYDHKKSTGWYIRSCAPKFAGLPVYLCPNKITDLQAPQIWCNFVLIPYLPLPPLALTSPQKVKVLSEVAYFLLALAQTADDQGTSVRDILLHVSASPHATC